MIMHFLDPDGNCLNINFDKHIWNDIFYDAHLTIGVSWIDIARIKEELDFCCFAYDKTDPTITPNEATIGKGLNPF